MQILLIAGFLGAGKTTLIRNLLQSPSGPGGRLAVLVNEVGKIGLDGALLSGRNVNLVEMTSGCICCSIKTDFVLAVQEIHRRFAPDTLIVEPTGVAQPGEILDILSQSPLKEFCRVRHIVTIIDAHFFKVREMLGPFYDRQILGADIILLNKIDLVDGETAREIQARLEGMNPRARIFPTEHCFLAPALLFEGSRGFEERREGAGLESEDLEEEGFQTFTFEDSGVMDQGRFVEFLESLPPSLFRCKGWAQFPDSSVIVNYSGGNYRLEPAPDPHPTALVLVGRKCPREEILGALKKCLTPKSAPDRTER